MKINFVIVISVKMDDQMVFGVLIFKTTSER